MNKCLFLLAIFSLLLTNVLSAQSTEAEICNEGDCSSAVFAIELDEPRQPDPAEGYSSRRTEAFKRAYTAFQAIKNTYSQSSNWQTNYEAFQLGGKSCLRHYQLESAFANEYLNNADFKNFVQQTQPNEQAFIENGFESSRRGLNLQSRMQIYCSRIVKDMDKQKGPTLADMPMNYNLLGQKLGYFDDKGNLLKPFQNPTGDDAVAMSDKEQVALWKSMVENLPVGEEVKNKINRVSNDLNSARSKVNAFFNFIENVAPIIEPLLPAPLRLLTNIGKIKGTIDNLLNLDLPNLGLKDKLKKLFSKGDKLGKQAKVLVDKSNKIKEEVENIKSKAKDLKDKINKGEENMGKLGEQLKELTTKQSKVLKDLEGKPKKVVKNMKDKVDEIVSEGKDFLGQVEKERIKKDDILQELENLEKQKAALEEEINNLKDGVETTEKETDELESATQEAQKVAEGASTTPPKEAIELAPEIETEAEELKKEFGINIKLESVPTKEWAENFEVEREYWSAIFHPDDEVVEGFQGRYFEVQLKDASKNVKLLFGPGEYFMNKKDFRDSYGSVIGAFVIEALHAMKKTDRDKVWLFVQGSADSAGQNSFRGQLDSRFNYNEISVLPYIPATDGFSNQAANKKISATSFTNSDLPNLRGNFLKEMISVYSKKLQPVLLEGQVQDEVNEGDRNAVIYLFIPDELVEKFEGN